MDLNKAKIKAKEEFEEEVSRKAVRKLKLKYHELHKAEQVVSNVKKEIEDLEASIEDGTFEHTA